MDQYWEKAGWVNDEELGRRVKFINKLMIDLKEHFGRGQIVGTTAYKYFEISSEALGTMHVQVYYDKRNESLEFDRYYENETLHDEYQKHQSVPMSFNDYDKMFKFALSTVNSLLS